ncbi:MAG TPA: polyketide antibiotic transporter [Mycobacterium sp.]|nr:polyketide antibiotic transporter [Mycobacterium sp.]
MTAATLPLPGAPTVPHAVASRALRRLTVRQIRRGALIAAGICAVMSAGVAAQYQTMFQGSMAESGLQALAENPAIRILFGAPVALDDAGGFTVWRTGLPVLVLASVWILLAATRITRGEEDAGRWDLLLAGRLRTVDLVLRSLTVIAGSAALISMAVGTGLIAAGTNTTGAIVYAAGILGVTLTFGTAGVLAAQIMPTRSSAVGVVVGLLGAGLLVRMLADGAPRLAWAAWTTPFGLTARAAPYADNRVAPLLVLAGFPLVFAVAGLVVARRRDIGSGLIAVATRRTPRTTLLGSIGGFAARRTIRPTIGWAAGIAVYFVLIGALIASILEFFDKNPRFAELAGAAGFGGLDSATGFAAALFSLLSVPTGLYAATRLAGMVADERARRWTPLFATPVSRIRLVCTEIAVTTVCVLVLHAAAGLAMWTGSRVTGAPLGIGAALTGALNSAPIAWLSVGAASLAVGWLPSAVGVIGAVPVAGGFLLNVITQGTNAPTWLANLSPFVHLAAVPNAEPDWVATAVFTAIGAGLTALGLLGYHRRDLIT